MGFFDWLFGNKTPSPASFKPEWRTLLTQHVYFYTTLSDEQKRKFENRMLRFLQNTRITGVKTEVEELDNVLVAASAVIPIFGFEGWEYPNLSEVLIYPDTFDDKFRQSGDGRTIMGMVGSGYMNGQMILSRRALRHGFENKTDKLNTAIHEFIHLIDKADGSVDGVLEISTPAGYIMPWLDLMEQKIEEIKDEDSDINPYGATDKHEFLTVAGEYFFERPHLLSKKHPKLYAHLSRIFNQDISRSARYSKRNHNEIGRNDPCPCGSGKKYKQCCLRAR